MSTLARLDRIEQRLMPPEPRERIVVLFQRESGQWETPDGVSEAEALAELSGGDSPGMVVRIGRVVRIGTRDDGPQ